jgi:hypothetical protein
MARSRDRERRGRHTDLLVHTPIFSCTHSGPRPCCRSSRWAVQAGASGAGPYTAGRRSGESTARHEIERGQARRVRGVSRWAVAVAAVTVAGCGSAPGSPSRSGRSRRAPQARASRDHARHRHLPPRRWAASRDERPLTRPAGPPDHAARGQPGVRLMLAVTIGPPAWVRSGPVSQPSGPPAGSGLVRVVTDPDCRAFPGGKASSRQGPGLPPRGRALSRCGHPGAGSRLAGRDLVAWVRGDGLVAALGEDAGSPVAGAGPRGCRGGART